MEIFLNLAWAALAIAIMCHWIRHGNRNGANRRLQWVALIVLIAVLLPVISVSDDLLAIQNPSETDSYLRRDHLVPSDGHSSVLPQPALLAFIFTGLAFGFLFFVSPNRLSVARSSWPECEPIQNRPPPVG